VPNCALTFKASAALAVAALLFASLAQPACAQTSAFVVRTTAGPISGVARPGGGAEFLGIPYAQPPVGDLRWREPVPAKSWTTVRDASSFGTPCAQPVLGDWNRHDAERSSEDCLYLNVITPAWPSKKPLPVMFWLHGGANMGGTASSSLYKDGTLPEHDVVLVTVNYRLAIFGFFAHPELTLESPHHGSGNYGLMDQILALHWVIDNIASFGGDPNNITVFGQSAGSMDTGMLMASPLSKNLFRKAIAESGAPFMPPLNSLAEAEQAGTGLATNLNVPAGTDPIQYLRQVPAHDLLAKVANVKGRGLGTGPDIDGWVIRTMTAETFANGQEAAIPLLIGTTAREFGSAEPPDELRKTIERSTGELAPRALALYGLAGDAQGTSDPLYGAASDQWGADAAFHCPIAIEAAWHSAAHHATYEYELDHAIPGQEAQGAVHSSDLPYVFGYFPKSGNIAGHFSATDYKLADLMETYWTNFARTGNPNSDNLPRWPELDGSHLYLQFTQNGTAVVSAMPLRGPQCSLFREVMIQRMNLAH
jgi:para-nitrobenzyl esterase